MFNRPLRDIFAALVAALPCSPIAHAGDLSIIRLTEIRQMLGEQTSNLVFGDAYNCTGSELEYVYTKKKETCDFALIGYVGTAAEFGKSPEDLIHLGWSPRGTSKTGEPVFAVAVLAECSKTTAKSEKGDYPHYDPRNYFVVPATAAAVQKSLDNILDNVSNCPPAKTLEP